MKIPTANLIILSALLLITYHPFAQKEAVVNNPNQVLKLLGISSGFENNHISSIDSILSEGRNVAFYPTTTFTYEPSLNFDGIDVNDASGATVPNANGDISGEHFIQVSNGSGSIIKIFDKNGSLVLGPQSLNTIWADFGQTGSGDPIVLWDPGAERWIFTELGNLNSNEMLIAVSTTSDPTGSFYVYSFEANDIPAYPKYAIWPNAFVVTTKEAGPDSPIYALDRHSMLNGITTDVQRLSIPKFDAANSFAFQTATPVDWDGALTPPSANSPHYVIRMYDDAWDGGADKLELWEVNIDWDNTNNSSITGPIDLFTTAFDSDVCNGSIFTCLPQPNGSPVSAMMQTLMHRVGYRNFGTHESIVLNHVIDVNGSNLAGIKWYELRKPSGGNWSIYQEGTWAPQDNNHRFMGSIAMDAAGNIGLAYSTVGPNKNLSLAYTGRLVSDPLNEMTISEYEIAAGLSLHNGFRWGDHSLMSVDETNGFSFWFTGEYMKENAEWGTKIISFQLHRDSIDIGAENILSPQNSAYLTANEVVDVQVKNHGLIPQSNFNIGLIVDDVFFAEKTVLDTIAPDSLLNLSFDEDYLDMSVVKDYDFKFYISYSEDDNILNDTFRTVVTKLPRFDVAISDFLDLEQVICDSFITGGIVIENHGAEVLDSVIIQWQCNSNPPLDFHWYGALNTGEKDTVFVILNQLFDGPNNLAALAFNPNGVSDENQDNDFLSRNFDVLASGNRVFFNLLTDDFPNETTWILTDDLGTILYEGGPYESPATNFVEEWCLVDACYTFQIFDAFGDGMSAPDNMGDYSIVDDEGKIFARLTEANFGSSELKPFCVPFVCSLESEVTTVVESEFAAEDGQIIINQSNGLAPFQYSINGGLDFQDNPVFTGLSGNIYYVLIRDANGCEVEKEIVLETCTLQFSIVATNATFGLSDGSILINTDGGIPPFRYSIDNGITFQDSSLFENLDTGNFIVVVQDSLGCSFTNQININSMTVGIEEANVPYNILISPNPTNGVFRIQVEGFDGYNNIDVKIFDGLGQNLLNTTLQRNDRVFIGNISLSEFASGIYFVRIGDSELYSLKKVLKR